MPFASLLTDAAGLCRPVALLALSTAGEANGALPFGLEMADLQRWTLIYLGLSSLAFVAVWVVGFLRR